MSEPTTTESGRNREAMVYRTRIVKSGFLNGQKAINHFSDPDEAKRYLETVIEERMDCVTVDWTREQSADEKWSMNIPASDERAIVMGCPLHESADEPIEAMRETLERMGQVEQ